MQVSVEKRNATHIVVQNNNKETEKLDVDMRTGRREMKFIVTS